MEKPKIARILLFLLGMLLGLGGVLPCQAQWPGPFSGKERPRQGGVYRRPLSHEPSSLDPARTTDVYANTVVNQLFDGLVQFDKHLNPIPAMAGFWEASLDGLRWTFYLRQGIRFHNGREVTAADVVYSFQRILDPALQSPVAEFFQYIQGVNAFREGRVPHIEGLQALDPYTLQIVLTEPYAPFLSVLAMANAKVVPREEVLGREERFARHPVGSGPFRFHRWEPHHRIELQANDAYYEGRPFLDRIVFTIIPQEAESFTAFLDGALEEVIIPTTRAQEVQSDPQYRRYIHLRKPLLHLLYIGFNTRKEPFTHPQVRQAFNYAVNKEAIVREITRQGSIVARGILPPGMPAYNPDLDGYYYSPRRARQLLAQAGYPEGKGLPVIDLWTSSQKVTTAQELKAYQEYLAEIGVRVEIHQAPNWQAFKERLTAGKASMFRLAWYADIPDPDNFLFPLLFSQSKMNRTFYQNPVVDRLLEQARRETNYLKRIAIYREVERRALNDAPWISQSHRVFDYLYQPYVRGVELNALGPHYIPMKKIWLRSKPDTQVQRER
ncbi:MAG: ABC transporter substrate-binding protein [Nitrospinota bacterium]|nr:MAG: ABC transporter substrate-binding protein [Nitrospinota bacterium]